MAPVCQTGATGVPPRRARVVTRVGVGDHVSQGETVGYVGSTGWSTGCHLHFTILVNGDAVDPMGWLP